jgi:hypothetical protein
MCRGSSLLQLVGVAAATALFRKLNGTSAALVFWYPLVTAHIADDTKRKAGQKVYRANHRKPKLRANEFSRLRLLRLTPF